ncbi:shikimate kinase [Tichowtungia aerotolerans]|uniref:Shikimate kinase n=1 Tax=Tichowtungia aerotolerans TaxID=2697043 RepID=A0A6P1M3C5_9BACT|nr:shikimate kinase [Tichowtungia aerotolerans]QHI68321.1 AAA family ATPase [Tichowtungia aerotolerans]
MSKKNIVLIGFMGTGKTVTGRVLAERTGMELVDMDSIIEERAGKPISDIFANEGEPAFRKLERALANELSQREGLIISTGGGVVLDPDNMADFHNGGLVVCLTASPETIFQRLENDTTRPLLSGDKKKQISGILETRKPLYDAIEHQIDGDRLDSEGRAEAILKLYELEN